MSARILSPSETRRELERIRHQPDTRLGQNFLVDGNIVRKSVRLAAIQSGDVVVEIGPGLGTLTYALLEAGAIVYAIEFDRLLYQHLNDTMASDFPDRLHLSQGDAVKVPLAGIPALYDGDFKIVANLPYAISTPWMAAILAGRLPQRMVLMLQAETASRLMAPHGCKNFSAISILLQSAYLPAESHRVSPNCFHPRPEVGSTLIRMDLRPDPVRLAPESMDLIRGLFRKRRKQIGSLLRSVSPEVAAPFLADLESAGLPPRTRPEAIPLARWHQLDTIVRSTGKPRDGKAM
ncbi:MAG: ribosomal RNA small subunit methyltransferase A [Verrucomicrobia bacterium]|nr:MAG: ribosomal RNA small subunit methyltransferase A [Verrucomicrobiota bacterium]